MSGKCYVLLLVLLLVLWCSCSVTGQSLTELAVQLHSQCELWSQLAQRSGLPLKTTLVWLVVYFCNLSDTKLKDYCIVPGRWKCFFCIWIVTKFLTLVLILINTWNNRLFFHSPLWTDWRVHHFGAGHHGLFSVDVKCLMSHQGASVCSICLCDIHSFFSVQRWNFASKLRTKFSE